MCNTELTVREWKLYLKEAGLPEWRQPAKDWLQTDQHPVVMVSWDEANQFCDWLNTKTRKTWRLPTNSEWTAAVGKKKYPWGDYYPPHKEDGNYSVLGDGSRDPKVIGVDGVYGTAPVASFKPNELGFYDLGGNVWEMAGDLVDNKCHIRGAGWEVNKPIEHTRSDWDEFVLRSTKAWYLGFRLVRQ